MNAPSDPSVAPRLHHEIVDAGTADDRRPYLFMIHGMLSDRRQWRLNLDAVSRHTRPVLIELWGHGDSPAPTDPACYTVANYMAQIDALRESLGADRIVLCGQSFGAALTLRYSVEHPDRVSAQIFTNTTSALMPPEAQRPEHEREALVRFIRAEGQMAIGTLPFHPRLARRLPPEVKEQLMAAAASVDTEAVALALSVTGPQLTVYEEMPRIACPTLLVNGMREGAFQEARDLVEARLPGCRIVDVPTAGHAVNIEEPEAFNEAASAFLAAVLR
ncbi:MAG: alpha/beta hydrolase [Burkholderiaceae bacterium]